jgi:hypothetical protein
MRRSDDRRRRRHRLAATGTRAGDDSPVVLLSSGGQAWEDTTVQANSIDEFIGLIETGRFRFRYDSAAYEPG